MCSRVVAVSALAWTAACSSGAGRVLGSLAYGGGSVTLRVGEPVRIAPTGSAAGGAIAFSIEPSLPAGLVLDSSSGELAGIPTAVVGATRFTVQATVGGVAVSASFSLAVGTGLPASVLSLADGFTCVRHTAMVQKAAKMAIAPDGRIFVTELETGWIRVVRPDGTLLALPFATMPVLTGGHLGLLGIALSPDFETDGGVFAYATMPAGGGSLDGGRLLRWRAVGDVGQDEEVLLDDLPISAINNGGALCFDQDGMLLVSVGDVESPALAQSDTSFAGKILRVRPADGGIPADNPDPASLIFAKGLRNTFALARHPSLPALFLADNGPASDDELNLLQPGLNYEWGASGASFGAATGAILRLWPDVVVPTALAFQAPATSLQSPWPPPFDTSLYLTLYDDQVVERFEMSGALATDIDREVEFLRFTDALGNTPVDIARGPAGQLWVLTFDALYRIDRIR